MILTYLYIQTHQVEDGQIIMFKKYEHRRIVFGDGKLANNDFKEVNNKTLIEFVQRYSLPFVVNFDHDSAQKAFRGWVDHHLLIFASRQNHSWDLINQQASAVAKRDEFYMKVLFFRSFIYIVSSKSYCIKTVP